MADLERISITIEPELLAQFDALLADGGTASRSEGVRDLIRSRLARDRLDDPDAEVLGTLTLCFDHHRRELAERLTALGHDHHHSVMASMHQHLDHDHCLEVITLRGPASRLRSFARAAGGLKGVHAAELAMTPVPTP